MKYARWFVSAAVANWCLIAPASAAEPAATGSAVTQAEVKESLSMHNLARRAVGSPPLAWSPELAKYAQAWADELARTGKFEHRPEDGEWAQKHGENIGFKLDPRDAVKVIMRGFLSEGKLYKRGDPITKEDAPKYGHYTAVVWKATTHVGAGKAVVQIGPLRGATIYVFNYDPRGNTLGEQPY